MTPALSTETRRGKPSIARGSRLNPQLADGQGSVSAAQSTRSPTTARSCRRLQSGCCRSLTPIPASAAPPPGRPLRGRASQLSQETLCRKSVPSLKRTWSRDDARAAASACGETSCFVGSGRAFGLDPTAVAVSESCFPRPSSSSGPGTGDLASPSGSVCFRG